MPKQYHIKPYRLAGREYFSATFYDAKGRRVNRGLGTSDEGLAQEICGGLVRLRASGATTPAQAPGNVLRESVELYFDLATRKERGPILAFKASAGSRSRDTDEQNSFLRGEVVRLSQESAAWKRKYEDLERSALGRAVLATKDLPPLPVALDAFEAHMRSETCKLTANLVTGLARRFVAQLPPDRKTLADVTAADVGAYLDQLVNEGDASKQASRRDYMRRRLGRFVNWSAKLHGYESPMKRVRSVAASEVDRERGEIVWHRRAEVESYLKSMKQQLARCGRAEDQAEYWRALVATLAYAGLRLEELVWLRVQDVTLQRRRGRIFVTAVRDPINPDLYNHLKTSNSKRSVDLHPQLLLPRIKKRLQAAATENEHWLFAVPKGARRRGRDGGGDLSRWLTSSLSHVLNGNPGGESRKDLPRLLPEGWTALTLRHTAGSLQLRSGKSISEVAAFLGNQEAVVKRHYARLLSTEVLADY